MKKYTITLISEDKNLFSFSTEALGKAFQRIQDNHWEHYGYKVYDIITK